MLIRACGMVKIKMVTMYLRVFILLKSPALKTLLQKNKYSLLTLIAFLV
jgi:hypothetical protein